MRKNIAVPSDDARFNPDMVSGLGVTDETIWKLLELNNADNSIVPDPLNTPVYINGLLGKTKQYFGVPVYKGSTGYFAKNKETSSDFNLIMDNITYTEGDYSNIKLRDGNKMTLFVSITAIGVVCVSLGAIILKRKKSRKQ